MLKVVDRGCKDDKNEYNGTDTYGGVDDTKESDWARFFHKN